MMSSEGEKKCPLCAEEMDWTDQQLKPCKCGYEVCVWCWHHIMDMAEKDETEGRCPACRAPYDKEKIVGIDAQCERVIAKKDREIKPQKPKPKKPEEKKDLSNVRVIQRKMAYVIGLPLSLADEDILQRKDCFGQYGKVTKISLSRTAGGAIQQFVNDSCSVYITYSKEEDAIRCIQSVHGFVLEGRSLRASFGTAKYCHAWLKNVLCNNPACLYLHSFGADEDSFGKDEEAAVHTRNRVHQIVGATHNMHWRSGTTLPPPLDEPLYSSAIITDKFISHSSKRELTSSGPLTCSISSKDQDERIKTPNRSFLDVVARPSSSPEHGNVTEDQKLLSVCSNFSSIVIDESYPDTEHSNDMSSKVSSTCQSPIAVLDKDSPYGTANSFRETQCYHLPLPDKETQHHAADSFRDPSKYSVSSVTDFTKEQFCLTSDSSQNNLEEDPLRSDDQVSVLASSYPVRYPEGSNGYAQQCIESSGARDINSDFRNMNMFGNQVSEPFSVFNSSSANGFYESKIRSHPRSDKKIRSNSFSGEEIVGQLRKLDDHNLTINVDSLALEAVENHIVSSILSLDFDSCDDSRSLPHCLVERYGESDGRNGSLWNSSKTDNSRFSFAKEGSLAKESSGLNSSSCYVDQTSRNYSLFSDYMGNDFVKKDNVYSSGSQNIGLMTQSSAPPGFSVTPKDPPPGFSSFEMTNQLHPTSSGSYLVNPVSYPNNQYSAMLNGHTRSVSDFNFSNQQNPMPNGHTRSASDFNFSNQQNPMPNGLTRTASDFNFNNQQNPMLNGHTRNVSDFDFNDPAILVVQGGKSMKGMNNLGIDSWQTSTNPQFSNSNPQYTNYDDEARRWHLMQQAGAAQQGTNFAPTFVPNQPFIHQEQNYSVTNGDRFSYMGNSFGVNSKIMMDQNQVYNPSSYSQFSQQKYVNGPVPNGVFSNQEVQRNDRLGFDNLNSGHMDLMYQMPNTGDVYNRVYGL